MVEAHSQRGFQGRAPKIAIGFAVVALLTSLVAVIVVVSRGGSSPGTTSVATPAPSERRVAANDVVKLKRDVVEKVADDSGKILGVKVMDAEVRTALGLGPDDIITAISGRTIKREFDVYDAVLGMSMMDTSVVYVDLLRDHKPALVRWQLDGDLRKARRGDATSGSLTRPPPTGSPARTLGTLGTGGTIDPFASPYGSLGSLGSTSDPLLDTITRIDAFHYEIPRATVDKLLANPMGGSGLGRGGRIVPAMKDGKPAGFKIYAIRPLTMWSTLGLQNGDTLRAINGFELTSPDKALEVYSKLRDATELKIEIERRGVDEILTYTIK